MGKEKPLVSVIIPVYNVQKYLEECVESVQNQSYTNLEIVLVDDGSTDNSGELCDALATKDTRICTLHKSNGGLSDARNTGMLQARGKYLTFLDGDDLLPHSAVEKLVSSCEKNHWSLQLDNSSSFQEKRQEIQKKMELLKRWRWKKR